jgi:hypothetical protein
MKVFLGFLIVCFYIGWLLHNQSMKRMALLLVGLSVFVSVAYFFLRMI